VKQAHRGPESTLALLRGAQRRCGCAYVGPAACGLAGKRRGSTPRHRERRDGAALASSQVSQLTFSSLCGG